MGRIPQPRYVCYLLENGAVAIGTRASLKKEICLKMQNGRSVKVEKRYLNLENCAIIPPSKFPDIYPYFEKMRGTKGLEKPLLVEYFKAEKYLGYLGLGRILKPFTITESDFVKELTKQMAPVQRRWENSRRQEEAYEMQKNEREEQRRLREKLLKEI